MSKNSGHKELCLFALNRIQDTWCIYLAVNACTISTSLLEAKDISVCWEGSGFLRFSLCPCKLVAFRGSSPQVEHDLQCSLVGPAPVEETRCISLECWHSDRSQSSHWLGHRGKSLKIRKGPRNVYKRKATRSDFQKVVLLLYIPYFMTTWT